MILADTSVWIDYIRAGDARMAVELNKSNLAIHPYVVGEVALGSFPRRSELLTAMDRMPATRVVRPLEVRQLIESHSLQNRGIGYVDAHLLASVLITQNCQLWTRDRRLRVVAESMKIHVQFP